MEPHVKVQLPPFYYLNNFHYLIDFVRDKSGYLLSKAELKFISDFKKLKRQERALYVRMFNRKGLFFNIHKFNYQEIKSVKSSIRNLVSLDFASVLSQEDLIQSNDVFKIFTKEELSRMYNLCSDKKLNGTLKKEDLVQQISSLSYIIEIINAEHFIVKQQRSIESEMIKFIFFGSADVDMTEFVIRDIGNVVFEEYEESKLSSYFAFRKEVEDKWKITQVYKKYKEKRDITPPAELYNWFKSYQFDNLAEKAKPEFNKFVNKLGYDLERNSYVEEALEVYSYTNHYPSRERRIRLLSQQDKKQEAFELCKQIIDHSVDPREKIFASDFINKTGRLYRQTTNKLKNAESINICKSYAGRVEEGAMKYFSEKGYNSFFSENYLWRSLFGLLFWDLIYDINSGAIHNPLQRAPTDLYSPTFLVKRQIQIDYLFKGLKKRKELRSKIKKTWNEKNGKVNPLFGWDIMQLKMLNLLLTYTTPIQLHKVLQEMCINLKSNCTGFPDLFIYNKNEYFFAEIKSPNDHLSDQQLFWLDFFNTHQINVKLIKVNWI